jgi:tetrahydromethanopterin S-methyltransferase subunit G
MSRFFVLLASLLFAALAFAAGIATSEDMKYLYDYGDALYYAYQGEWFEAIARLDAQQAQTRGPDESEFDAPFSYSDRLVGDFELNYRMHQRAGRAMKAVIEGNVKDDLRNEAIFRLARMYFQKDQPENALQAVELIRGAVPETIRSDLAFLRANIDMANGRNAEAVTILKDLQSEKSMEGFSSYNLGIALLKNGNEQNGREYLDRTGRIKSDDPATLAIKDKANLVLGEKLLSENNFEAAKQMLDRVRLSGPFSNRALLSSGWTDASRERFENALVPWSILAEREVTDPAVQEAMLAVPYAYSRLGVYSTAARKYETALKAFGREIEKLGASITSIRQGKFLKVLVREELQQDANWVVKLRELPETPETFYLLDLMASNDFQESLKNYLDLEQLRKKLEAWSGDLVAFEDIIRQRSAHYEPLLPAIDREFSRLDSQMRLRLEQRDLIEQQLQAMLEAPRPDLLITADEHAMSERIAHLEKMVTPQSDEAGQRFGERVRRLRGALYWNINTEYDKRFADVREHLHELNQELESLHQQHAAFVLARQAVTESYQGYGDVIRDQRLRIKADREKVQLLMVQQGQVLEIMAVNELSKRRDRLEEFQVKARFALADSYDRASKAQLRKRDGQ